MANTSIGKTYSIGASNLNEAKAYVRYLHKHALFGGHVGLPESVRNKESNRSLVSNIGNYAMLDVYSLSGQTCLVGTVVNFYEEDSNNVEGLTYVYPCTDASKPLGYMITKAEPDVFGVCVIRGVIEVPLYYFNEDEDVRTNYVKYDVGTSSFKFSDSGYPVFNVYQDVDGDWIAIILFGDVPYEYDGPFAVSIAGVTGSTTYVNVNSGDVLFNDIRGTYDEDLTTQLALNTGESVWLKTSITGNTHAYDLIATSTTPIDGSTVFYTELAKNVGGNIVQNQYGDIRYSRTKLIAGSNRIILSPVNGLGDVTIDVNEGAVGTTQDLTLTGSTVLGGGTASIGITDSTSKINIIPENDLYVRTGTGTNELILGSTTTAYTNVSTSVSGATDASISFSNINGLAKTVDSKAGSHIQLSADGNTGIIVSATGGSVTPYVQDITHSFSTGTATLGLTGSAITVSFTTAGNTYIKEGDGGTIIIGSTSGNLLCASTGTTGLYSLYVSDTSGSKVYLKEGAGISLSVSGSTITITGTTYTEGTGIDITNGTITNLLTGDGTTIQVSNNIISYIGGMPSPQNLSVSVSGNTANVGITDGTGFSIIAEGNTYINESSDGFIIGSTYSLPSNVYQDLTCSISEDTDVATIGITESTSKVKISGGTNISLSEGENGGIVINSICDKDLGVSVSGTTAFVTITDGDGFCIISEGNTYLKTSQYGVIVGSTYTLPSSVYQDLTSSVNGGTAFVGITDSSSKVKFNGKGNVEITKVRATASAEEMATWGTRPDGTPKNAGWKGIIPISDGRVMTEETIGVTIGGEEVDIPLITPHMDDDELYVVSLLATGKIGVNDVPDEIINKAKAWAGMRIGQGKSPYYNGDASDESLRVIDTDSIVILGLDYNQHLYNSISGGTVTGGTAFIGITGSDSSVNIVGGSNTLISDDGAGNIVIDCIGGATSSTINYDGPFAVYVDSVGSNNSLNVKIKRGYVSIGGRFFVKDALTTAHELADGCSVWARVVYEPTTSTPSVQYSYTPTYNYPASSSNSFLVELARNVGGVLEQVHFGGIESTDDVSGVLSSLELFTSVTGNTAYININGSTNDAIRIKGSTNVILEEGWPDDKEIMLDVPIRGLTHSILGGSTASISLIGDRNTVEFVGVGLVDISGNTKGQIIISGTAPDLTSSVFESNGKATIGLTGSTSSVVIKQGSNVSITEGQNGEIVLGATGGGSQDISASVSGGTAFIGLSGSANTVKIRSGGNITIGSGGTDIITLTGSTSGGSSYELIVSGGSTSKRLNSGIDYIVWIKEEDGTPNLPYVLASDLRSKYSSIEFHSDDYSDDTHNLILELPMMNATSSFNFIKVDNRLRSCDILIVDTEKKGIVFGDPVQIARDSGGVYSSTAYHYNTLSLGTHVYMMMYDPVELDAYDYDSGSYHTKKAHWFIWPLED